MKKIIIYILSISFFSIIGLITLANITNVLAAPCICYTRCNGNSCSDYCCFCSSQPPCVPQADTCSTTPYDTCGPAPTNTPMPPTNTPVPPTNTPIPPTNPPPPTPTNSPIPPPTAGPTSTCSCNAGYYCVTCGPYACIQCAPLYVSCQNMSCGTDPVDGTDCGKCLNGFVCSSNNCVVDTGVTDTPFPTNTPSGPSSTPACNWNGCGTSYCGKVTDGCGIQHNCPSNSCVAPDVCDGTYCVNPTPTQSPWTKLKNTSFQSINNLTVTVPVNPAQFDSSDSGSSYFIDGVGMVSNPVSSLSSNQSSSLNWKASSYNPNVVFSKDRIVSYINSKKQHILLTSLSSDWKEITQTGIYYLTGDFTITESPILAYPFVLVSDGTVTINSGTSFSPASSVAVIAKNININETVGTINAILIANNIITGISTTKLKITGNLIAQNSFLNNRSDPITLNHSPSVFINFDPSQYIDLLPFLSVDKYEWEQLQ